jgi:hypothetical protein
MQCQRKCCAESNHLPAGIVVGGTAIALPANAANSGWVVGGPFTSHRLHAYQRSAFISPQSKFRFRKYIVCGKACLESALFAGPKTPRTSAAIVCDIDTLSQTRQSTLLRLAVQAIAERVKTPAKRLTLAALSQIALGTAAAAVAVSSRPVEERLNQRTNGPTAQASATSERLAARRGRFSPAANPDTRGTPARPQALVRQQGQTHASSHDIMAGLVRPPSRARCPDRARRISLDEPPRSDRSDRSLSLPALFGCRFPISRRSQLTEDQLDEENRA